MPTHSKVWLKRGREKSLLRKHPWVFSGAIDHVQGEAGPGATVAIVDAAGAFLAWAAYSPASQIRARVWSFEPEESIDAGFLRGRLERAIESRRRLGLLGADTACRLVFAESDGLPGLVVDRYADFVVCQFLSAGAERWRAELADLLVELCGARGIYERSEASARRKEGLPSQRGLLARRGAAGGDRGSDGGDALARRRRERTKDRRVPRPAAQSRARRRARGRCGDARRVRVHGRVRDHGAASRRVRRDARRVVGRGAAHGRARGGRERRRRPLSRSSSRAYSTSCALLRDDGRRYDLVVLDPPKFVHSAEQVSAGSRGYKDVNMLGLRARAAGRRCSRRSPARGTSTPRCSRRSSRAPRSTPAATRRFSSACLSRPDHPDRDRVSRGRVSQGPDPARALSGASRRRAGRGRGPSAPSSGGPQPPTALVG